MQRDPGRDVRVVAHYPEVEVNGHGCVVGFPCSRIEDAIDLPGVTPECLKAGLLGAHPGRGILEHPTQIPCANGEAIYVGLQDADGHATEPWFYLTCGRCCAPVRREIS